jgi:predicted ATPase
MRRALPSGTVTFLFTDVEGSTRLLHELGAEAYAEALAEHRKVIRETCDREGGVEVDTQGDAFFFAFPTAPGAISAAAAIREALASGPIQVRVGLHTGTPLLTEEGYVGEDVHRAARIAAAGHGGQVLASSSTAPLVELELRDLGEHRFKDLSAPERVFQVGQEDFPPLKTLYQTNLPIPQTQFLGREKELGEVLALLARNDVRLLTLTGPGGTGKTRLAAQAAGALADRYPDGVFWVPLAPLRDPALVLESAGQALGASNGLASHICDKRMLLLFDNFEQVVDAAPGLSLLLSECPQLELLVTSREPLHLAGEHEYPVPPLAAKEGVGFFLARARAAKPDFEVDEAVPEICRRLDELPLALELAAARVKALSTDQILARLEQRLPLLTGGSRDAPERQRTLRSTIEWSYDLLSSAEQQLFHRLAVFAGGCTLEAAEEVCHADLDTLQSLVEKSLLRFSNERYWMLETIREYAGERLEHGDERAALRGRHAEHFVSLAERAEPELEGADGAWWLDHLDADRGNFRVALTWLGMVGANGLRLRLVGALWRFLSIRGYLREGRDWLETAIATSNEVGEPRAKALHGAGVLASTQGDQEGAESLFEEAVAEYRRLGDRFGVARCVNALGNVAFDKGDYPRAAALYEESVVLFRELDDRRGVSNALGNLGSLALYEADYARAAALIAEAIHIQRKIGNLEGVALALGDLGLATFLKGDRPGAVPFFMEGVHLSQELGYKHVLAFCLDGIAAFAATRRPDDAGRLFGAADALRESIGIDSDPAKEIVSEQRSAVRERLGLSGFEGAHAEGRLLEPEEAASLALSCLD